MVLGMNASGFPVNSPLGRACLRHPGKNGASPPRSSSAVEVNQLDEALFGMPLCGGRAGFRMGLRSGGRRATAAYVGKVSLTEWDLCGIGGGAVFVVGTCDNRV